MPCILKIQSWLFICAFQKQIDLPDLFESTNMLWFHRHIAAKGLKIHCYELLIIVEPKKVSVQCNKNDMVDTCRHVVDIFSSCHRTLQWWNFCLFWVHSKIRNSLRANFKNSAKCNFIKFMSDVFFPKITSVIPSSVLSTLLQGTSGLEGASLLSLSIFIGLCMKILIGPHWPFFILCHPPISKSHQPTVHAQDFQILAEDQVNHIGCFHLSIPYEDSMIEKNMSNVKHGSTFTDYTYFRLPSILCSSSTTEKLKHCMHCT